MKKKNSWLDSYVLIENLGKGGNATVYFVKEKSTNKEFALKELYNKNPEKKARFVNEIHIAKKYASTVLGIIPIIDFSENEYWYTMPVAIRIQDYVKSIKIDDIVLGVIQLAETLEKLHEEEISHRDIKPSNIYFYNHRFCFGDFGIAKSPDNPSDYTKDDKALGAIFTIAPEMKRNPQDADGKKADVFSLAKTMWMLLSENYRGFDGTYNHSDESHSLRYIEKYKKTHLVELEELLQDATNNKPNLRPNIIEFKKKLNSWIDVYHNNDEAQAINWNFLTKQLFGSNPPESSKWTDINAIVNVLNTVGKSPAYNHMFFSHGGGLDFHYAELSNETGCISLYDKNFSYCFIVQPKCLYYEGFNDNYRWNYFLLELNELNSIFEKSNENSYEILVEDTPAHYVSASCAQYGVYDYDTGKLLPEGYKVVSRYIKGKFLFVMTRGPYNQITATYDGRHGSCSNSDFRHYIDSLVLRFTELYTKAKQYSASMNINDHDIGKKILQLREFNKNPFSPDMYICVDRDEKNKKTIRERTNKFIKENFGKWCFKTLLEDDDNSLSKVKFFFKFNLLDSMELEFSTIAFHNFWEDIEDITKYICKDGYIKELKSPSENDCYYAYNRIKAISLGNNFNQTIDKFIHESDLCPLEKYESCISIGLIKCGKPAHLFTKQEIEEEMRRADDRVSNQLVVDEDGYAKVIKDEGYGYLYPVRNESWNAGNVYVGKYSKLLTLDKYYIASLQGWLSYLETGQNQYIDQVDYNIDEKELLNEIDKYY